MDTEFKITLAAARINAGLTQDDVAKKMHVSKNTVVNWEKNRISPRMSEMGMLAEIYSIPVRYIFLPSKST